MTDYSVGDVYFRLVYPDADLLYPLIQSFVFVGMNLSEEDDEETWYFQFAEDYAKYGSILESSQCEQRVSCELRSTVSCMLDLEGLNKELVLAGARRINKGQA